LLSTGKVFTPPTTERSKMSVATLEQPVQKIWTLTGWDRCDRCDSQAYVAVRGLEGELMFCAHHYNKIMNDGVGYLKMMDFMIQIIDERSRLG
jgi:hypothetical protein